MNSFRVWAPKAKKVEVEVRGERLLMSAGENGWWFAEISSVEPGTDYAFVLDGGKPLPDPRSPWQPHGIHGPSRTVDHGAFPWTDRRWQAGPLSAAVFYELHIGTFTPDGTFKAAIEKLDHLVRLGITHVELMPVAEFSGSRGWGYDGVYPYAPHHAYGEPDDLKRLVDACHARGLAIVLDVVYNHLGPAGNYLDRFGPYFTDRYATPWGAAVNFDGPFSDEVRRFFCDNALMWLRDYHFDGLRLDAVHAILDTSAMHFLEQLACEVADLEAQIGRHQEPDRRKRSQRSSDRATAGTRRLWHRRAMERRLPPCLALRLDRRAQRILRRFRLARRSGQSAAAVFVYDGRYSVFRKRRHGKRPAGLSGHRFLGYLQNHDQIGNRAQGRTQQPLDESWTPQDRRSAGPYRPLRSTVVSRRGVGRKLAVSLLYGSRRS